MSSCTLPGETVENVKPGITCTKCGGNVKNYDPGSLAYQEYYGHPLPAICDRCLDEIFWKVKSHHRRE